MLSRHSLLAPDLLVAHILWKTVRRNELSEEEASLAARPLARADIELVPMRPLLERGDPRRDYNRSSGLRLHISRAGGGSRL
jgi:predicted nucleic acid-binding protein